MRVRKITPSSELRWTIGKTDYSTWWSSLLASTTVMADKMECCCLADVVVWKSANFIQWVHFKDHKSLVWKKSFVVLNLLYNWCSYSSRLNFMRNCLTAHNPRDKVYAILKGFNEVSINIMHLQLLRPWYSISTCFKVGKKSLQFPCFRNSDIKITKMYHFLLSLRDSRGGRNLSCIDEEEQTCKHCFICLFSRW